MFTPRSAMQLLTRIEDIRATPDLSSLLALIKAHILPHLKSLLSAKVADALSYIPDFERTLTENTSFLEEACDAKPEDLPRAICSLATEFGKFVRSITDGLPDTILDQMEGLSRFFTHLNRLLHFGQGPFFSDRKHLEKNDETQIRELREKLERAVSDAKRADIPITQIILDRELVECVLAIYCHLKQKKRAKREEPFNCYILDGAELSSVISVPTQQAASTAVDFVGMVKSEQVRARIKETALYRFIEVFLRNPHPRKMQLLVGIRDHYACVDITLFPDGRKTACVLDAANDARGFTVLLALCAMRVFDQIYYAKSELVTPQRDRCSCGVFAFDQAMHFSDRMVDEYLTRVAGEQSDLGCFFVRWENLPPELVWNFQQGEVDFFQSYVEHSIFGQEAVNKKEEKMAVHVSRNTARRPSTSHAGLMVAHNIGTERKMLRYVEQVIEALRGLKDSQLEALMPNILNPTHEMPREADLAARWFPKALALERKRFSRLPEFTAEVEYGNEVGAAAAAVEAPRHS